MKSRARTLVAEDRPEVLNLMALMLSCAGCDVARAQTGAEGLRLTENKRCEKDTLGNVRSKVFNQIAQANSERLGNTHQGVQRDVDTSALDLPKIFRAQTRTFRQLFLTHANLLSSRADFLPQIATIGKGHRLSAKQERQRPETRYMCVLFSCLIATDKLKSCRSLLGGNAFMQIPNQQQRQLNSRGVQEAKDEK